MFPFLPSLSFWHPIPTTSQISQHPNNVKFLSDPGVPGVRSMGPDVTPRLCADLTDVTLADEDSNSTPADYVNRAILCNVAMQVAPPGGQN